MSQSHCRICSCTEVNACDGGCGWAEVDLCDTCRMLLDELVSTFTAYLDVAGPAGNRRRRAVLMQDFANYPATMTSEIIAQRLLVAVREACLEIVRAARPLASPESATARPVSE
jgi:hypothetical protein